MQLREKSRKVAKHGQKVETKAAGAEPTGQIKLPRRCGANHILKSKMAKHVGLGPLFAVAMSKRRCGAKHVRKSKVAKHTILEPLLEVEMSKKKAVL